MILYRNVFQSSFQSKTIITDGIVVRSAWRNAGVAPCLHGSHPIWTLCNEKGETRAVLVDSDFDVLLLTLGEPVGQARERQFALPPLMKPGFYTVQISFGDPTGTPVIALPLDTVDGLRRYRIGELRIE